MLLLGFTVAFNKVLVSTAQPSNVHANSRKYIAQKEKKVDNIFQSGQDYLYLYLVLITSNFLGSHKATTNCLTIQLFPCQHPVPAQLIISYWQTTVQLFLICDTKIKIGRGSHILNISSFTLSCIREITGHKRSSILTLSGQISCLCQLSTFVNRI